MNLNEYVAFDCETTIKHSGNPFDVANKLCYVGVKSPTEFFQFGIEYTNDPYGSDISRIDNLLSSAKIVVGFNIKFDLHWLKNYGAALTVSNIWDCQLAAYLLSGQTKIYPSLEVCCTDAGLGSKLDVVKTEYWDKGIDTDSVPWDILSEYGRQDVLLTEQLYLYQRRQFEQSDPRLYRLFRLGCADMLWLLEAERNGMRYNVVKSAELAAGVRAQVAELDEKLKVLWPQDFINWASPDHKSIILFGGDIYVTGREKVQRTLKDGTVKESERNCWVPVHFERLIEPNPRTEGETTRKIPQEILEATNKDRVEARKKPLQRTYSTQEDILKGYKATGKAKETIGLLLKRAELQKLLTTYYEGIPNTITEMGWPEDTIHGSFMQVTTRTGRLSSKEPNLQNFAGLIKPLFYTRFPTNV